MEEKRQLNRMTVSLTLAMVPVAFASGMIGILLNEIIAFYQLEGTREGLMSSMVHVGALLSLFVSLPLRSRLTKVRVVSGFGLLIVAAILLMSVPAAFPAFLAFCLLMGAGMGTTDAFLSALMADLHKEKADRYLGIQHAVFGVGNLVLPVAMHFALRYMDWHRVTLLSGIICLLCSLQFILRARRARQVLPAMGWRENALDLSELSNCFTPAYIATLVTVIFWASAQNWISVWTIRYVTNTMQMPQIAALCLTLFWVGTTLSRLIAPSLPVSPAIKLLVGCLLGAACWAAGILIGTAPMLLASMFLTGLFTGAGMPLALGISARLNPGRTGLATVVLSIVKTVGQILTPLLVATLNTHLGTTTAMLLVCVVFVITGVAALGTRRPAEA